jgi:hypothetical protein
VEAKSSADAENVQGQKLNVRAGGSATGNLVTRCPDNKTIQRE